MNALKAWYQFLCDKALKTIARSTPCKCRLPDTEILLEICRVLVRHYCPDLKLNHPPEEIEQEGYQDIHEESMVEPCAVQKLLLPLDRCEILMINCIEQIHCIDARFRKPLRKENTWFDWRPVSQAPCPAQEILCTSSTGLWMDLGERQTFLLEPYSSALWAFGGASG